MSALNPLTQDELLMEQVLAPNFKFKPRFDNDTERTKPGEIKIRGFKKPSTKRVENIIESDLNDLKAAILQDDKMLKAMPGNIDPEVMNKVLIPKIIKVKYPDLSDEELEEVRQHVVADSVITKSEIKESGGKKFISMAGKFINLDDLHIDLIDRVNPFQKAFEILSKSVTKKVLHLIQESIQSTRITMDFEEAKILWPKILKFKKEQDKEPSLNSNDPQEVRMAECIIYLKEEKESVKMDKDSILDEIFANDPDGILEVKSRATPVQNEDQRLVSSFEEINDFVDTYGREPERKLPGEIETSLYSRLKGLCEHDDKIQALQEYDRHKLLVQEEDLEINSMDDIFSGDYFGLLEDEEDIFTLKHVPKEIKVPEYKARQKPCKDFHKYEEKFIECHRDLVEGKRRLLPYANEQYLDEGSFFILKGVMVYIADKGKKEKVNGKINARLHCIYENGTESDLLLRSLSRELYRDGKRITEHEDRVLNKLGGITEEGEATGFIYILKSKSEDDRIKTIANLYKIGFSKVAVQERIRNAENEPTYLMAPVSLVSAFECYNMNPQKLEQLLHKFFGKACLNIDIFDKNGGRYTPREWFVAPIDVIEKAIELILTGEIIHYRYDGESERIVENI